MALTPELEARVQAQENAGHLIFETGDEAATSAP